MDQKTGCLFRQPVLFCLKGYEPKGREIITMRSVRKLE